MPGRGRPRRSNDPNDTGDAAGALPLTPTLAQTEVSGPISIDTAWTAAGGPYILRGDVEVVRGAVLTIGAGVEVLGDPGVGLFVGGEGNADFGTLIVAGEAGQPVRFDAADRTAGRCTFRRSARPSWS